MMVTAIMIRLGLHVSAMFVILIVSTLVTLIPIPLSVYLFVRYFGAFVIIATASAHLLDPAYEAISPASCVGLDDRWWAYIWPPAIALSSAVFIFLLDFLGEYYVEKR
ncbi:hypothetical protein E4U55_002492 [Claviceps digitariae]|nr:hypothetical protein E4U55_002492 [Claviceps digitariae]